MSVWIWAAAAFALALSFWRDRRRTKNAVVKTWNSLRSLLPGVLAMVVISGALLELFPERRLVELFNVSGTRGLLGVAFIGAILNMPGPIAFPLSGMLLEMGVRPAVLAAFITSLTMVGVVTAPLEIANFGWRFTLWRQALSFIAALVIGIGMGALL